MKNYFVGKIGGAGLMMLYQELFDWVRYIVKDAGPDQIIIIVSALAKITRLLQEIFENKLNGETEKALLGLEDIKRTHLQRCKDLFIEDTATLHEYFFEIEYFIKYGDINKSNPTISNAYLLKFGELMSSEIFRQFLLGMNLPVNLIDAQKMIFASGEDYCNSIPIQPKTSESISRLINLEYSSGIILTQGYICNKRLLGLDGSDLTASLIALGLQLCNPNCHVELTFWKDVDGVIVDGVVKEEISIDEYNSLETVPVRKDSISTAMKYKYKILTLIRSFLNLNHQGTIISR